MAYIWWGKVDAGRDNALQYEPAAVETRFPVSWGNLYIKYRGFGVMGVMAGYYEVPNIWQYA